ncbi:hypothetical protein [Bacillus mesophilum]|uniref:Uncharacterized protein n=1 Tax=Bacillus mesophilum TaxID=1071718 RepID=A0A7V7RQA2_9BACI|nr:hypothetical protein [Bacillus mesophilum]KAB2335588.1 hypothetical protein F7732_03170 [Bacillus mesophilum]
MLEEFLASLIPNGSTSLDTRKIDRNIEMLKNYSWFKDIYDDERYHRLFFVNRKVRMYLQNTYRVKKIIKNEDFKIKFIKFLNEQL